MFAVIDLSPLDTQPKPSHIILHPLLAPQDLDEFSLPLSFPVGDQALLHIEDERPVIFCNRPSCDVFHNGYPATAKRRRLHSGDMLKITSSDSPSIFATYAIQVAYFTFSSHLRQEVSIDVDRMALGAKLALQTDTTHVFPLMLPLSGKLPSPAPDGTNWSGVHELIDYVHIHSSKTSVRPQEQLRKHTRGPSSSVLVEREIPLGTEVRRTYGQLITTLAASAHPLTPVPPASPSLVEDSSDGSSDLPVSPPTCATASSGVAPTSVSTSPSQLPSSPPCPVPTSSSLPVSSPSQADPVPAHGNSSAFSPSTGRDGLTVALQRIRQGWIQARQALSGADASLSPPALTSVMNARLCSIARVQSELLALHASITHFAQPGSDHIHGHVHPTSSCTIAASNDLPFTLAQTNILAAPPAGYFPSSAFALPAVPTPAASPLSPLQDPLAQIYTPPPHIGFTPDLQFARCATMISSIIHQLFPSLFSSHNPLGSHISLSPRHPASFSRLQC
ncbi:unnamed protein product [Tilletia controversa]|uniref:FHA domain-containing protein n=2 Tax=Tilletia TaxID=13289 RepID=A0A177T317_9BASI|nr:hypothetical protein CF336_g8988 [Tilletia laevis]KAE8181782.1 hypothetical protein CF328_g8733 [Tilletia controversa]KAE8239927.1 hypothetical protein A4X03_0g8641 [Tilletia caries]KAE8182133.1 hypothetical protein CF335_g8730 [Tilletia laevis]CAD6889952.1 unnamed protein product [Tilletia caries]